MKNLDLIRGSLTKSIFLYTIPLIFSTILQNLFNIADKAVLGNMAGSVAVAAIAATGTISSLVINGAVGLSSGTAIVLARYIGEENAEKIRATIGTSLIASVIIGVLCAFTGMALAPFFLNLTNCPAECYDGALIYIRIIMAGAPATLLYNFGSAILRTIGDTQKSLVYIAIAGVVNVVLNIILCLILPQKEAAVAIATVVSNIISAALVVRRLCRIDSHARVDILHVRFYFSSFIRIVRFGVPALISNLVLPLGNIQITTAINSFGTDAIAGHAAAVSAESVGFAFANGFSSAAMTYIGQSIGAKNVKRVRNAFWLCLVYSFVITGTIGLLTYLTGELWIGLIIGTSSAAPMKYGMLRLFYVAAFMFIHAISTVLIGTLKAFGYPMFASFSNIFFNLGFRVFWMQFIYPHSQRFSTIMLCYTVSWILNFGIYVIATLVIYRRYVIKGIYNKI